MSVSMETTQKIKNARPQQPKGLEQIKKNELEVTCSYMHLITFDLLILYSF